MIPRVTTRVIALPLLLIAFTMVHLPAMGRVEPFRSDPASAAVAYRSLPVNFEANRGQADPDVRFVSRGSGYGLFLKSDSAVLSLRTAARSPIHSTGSSPTRSTGSGPARDDRLSRAARLEMRLVGGDPRARPFTSPKLPGRVSYFTGGDPKQWRTNVPTHARAGFREVYPGIDVVYYSSGRDLEYDFTVAPGTDPSVIQLRWRGAGSLRIDPRGDLVIGTPAGPVRMRRPLLYQEKKKGRRTKVTGGYVMRGRREVGFRVERYDRSRPLVIDPVLSYATYLGGSAEDNARAVAVDAQGNVYVTGNTLSLDFPARDSFDTRPHPSPYGGYQNDAFVVKLDPTGTKILYAAYLGGSQYETGRAIAVDGAGCAWITGRTTSYPREQVMLDETTVLSPRMDAFPTTPNAFDRQSHTGEYISMYYDAFVARLSPDGSTLLYSTYLGRQGDEEGRAIAIDRDGAAWVAGASSSSKSPLAGLEYYEEFPTTPDALQPHYAGGPYDAFLLKIDPNASGVASLAYSTYLGGTGDDGINAMAIGEDGNITVAGATGSADFPVSPGAFQTVNHPDPLPPMTTGDAFVTRFDPTGKRIVYSTFLGGSLVDSADAIAVDRAGNAHITGWTLSYSLYDRDPFPTTPGAFQNVKAPDSNRCLYSHVVGDIYGPPVILPGMTLNVCEDAFAAKINPDGTGLVYSTFLGGTLVDKGVGVVVDAAGDAWVAGRTTSTDFPRVGGAADPLAGNPGNSFLTKLDPGGGVLLLTHPWPGIAAIALDPAGGLVLTGTTPAGLPVTAGAPQATPAGGIESFIARIVDDTVPPPPAGPLPPSRRHVIEISGGPVVFGAAVIPSLLIRATPRPGQPSSKATIEVRRTDGRVLSLGEVSFPGDRTFLDLYSLGEKMPQGDTTVSFTFPDATLAGAVSLPLPDDPPGIPQPRVTASPSGSYRLDWQPVRGARDYWVEVYERRAGENGTVVPVLVGKGDAEGETSINLPAAIFERGKSYQVVMVALSIDPRAGALESTFTGTAGASEPFTLGGVPSLTGDLDGNGRVNIRDAILLLRITVGLATPDANQRDSGDLNADGRVNIQDVILLLRKITGGMGG